MTKNERQNSSTAGKLRTRVIKVIQKVRQNPALLEATKHEQVVAHLVGMDKIACFQGHLHEKIEEFLNDEERDRKIDIVEVLEDLIEDIEQHEADMVLHRKLTYSSANLALEVVNDDVDHQKGACNLYLLEFANEEKPQEPPQACAS